MRAELDDSRRETEQVRREAAAVEKDLQGLLRARDAKIGDLEDEIEEMQGRLIELETLLVEQQKALETLVGTTLREVAKREKLWTEQRSSRDSKIELLKDLAENKASFGPFLARGADMQSCSDSLPCLQGGAAETAAQAVQAYEKEFEQMEKRHQEEVEELKAEKASIIAKHEEEKKKKQMEQQLHQRTVASRQADYEKQVRLQEEQISELLRQKAWLSKQLGAPQFGM